eukprot:scaffold955_cov325-Prasinococcus_capsulatus_cf.AAC.2
MDGCDYMGCMPPQGMRIQQLAWLPSINIGTGRCCPMLVGDSPLLLPAAGTTRRLEGLSAQRTSIPIACAPCPAPSSAWKAPPFRATPA